jgi:DNA-binding transcriptional LysR family regulator
MVLLDECRQVISDLQAGHAGRLLLGAGVTTSIFHLPGWLRAFREAYPGIEVVVRTGGSREVADMALEREIDLGLITSPMQHPDLNSTDLFEEEIVLVTPPDHPFAGKEIAAEEFASVPLILFPRGTGFREYLDKSLEAAGVPMTVKMETDSVEAIKSFVAVGLGASFLPAAAAESELKARTLSGASVSGLPALKRTTSVVHRKDRHLSTAARGFLSILPERYSRRYKPAGLKPQR